MPETQVFYLSSRFISKEKNDRVHFGALNTAKSRLDGTIEGFLGYQQARLEHALGLECKNAGQVCLEAFSEVMDEPRIGYGGWR